ncbi:MAG: queuosine salvage family protein [Chloroflexota bacterium]|nr:queuosine salvage family protein [Chloroflexota bacterium]
MSLLDQVRAHAAQVVAHARYVAIAWPVLSRYARSLPLEAARAPALDPATHYFGAPDETLAFVVTLDAINFGSGYFPMLRKRPGMSGYFTVAASLKDRFDAHGPWSPAALRELTTRECAVVFGQSLDDPEVRELMRLFAQALNDLGAWAEAAGSFRALVERAGGSAERLVEVLTEMPFYRDVGFYKRAQLTAADLSTAGVASFADLDRLTIFADNLVPHVLRVDGVLRYQEELLARINREELIASGSREEVEIRATALHAVELMVAELRGQGEAVTPMQLDYLLWNRGQGAAYKAQPRHRVRCVFY